jgi:hypothetical protein
MKYIPMYRLLQTLEVDVKSMNKKGISFNAKYTLSQKLLTFDTVRRLQ